MLEQHAQYIKEIKVFGHFDNPLCEKYQQIFVMNQSLGATPPTPEDWVKEEATQCPCCTIWHYSDEECYTCKVAREALASLGYTVQGGKLIC